MENFVDRYLQKARETESVLCVGLDPTVEHIPKSFGRGLPAMERYLKEVIDMATGLVPCVKPQYAYYAALGTRYIEMMIRIIDYAHSRGMLVILDAKRADIGATMERYGIEVFGQYGVDACTFVPYLGPTFMPDKKSESWLPWLMQGRMVISMIRTSNEEAAWLQDQKLESGLFVYEFLAAGVKEWNREVCEKTEGLGRVGGVVGATWPNQATRCRDYAGDDVFFLIPGYGAQGGGAAGAVEGLVNGRGELMGTVNTSRDITLNSWFNQKTRKPKPGDPMDHVHVAIEAANVDLNQALEAKIGQNPYLITVQKPIVIISSLEM